MSGYRIFGFIWQNIKILGACVMRHSVLIIDNESIIADILKNVLPREPYAIITAASVDEAFYHPGLGAGGYSNFR